MKRSILALSTLGALLGCGTQAATEKKPAPTPDKQAASAPTPAAPATEKKDEPRTDYLVIAQQPGAPSGPPQYQTVWLKGGTAGEELARRDGAAASDGKGLWFWTDKGEPVKGLNCECAERVGYDAPEAELKKCETSGELPAAAFVDPTRRERPIKPRRAPASAPGGAPGEGELSDFGELSSSVSLLAVLGPWVFYQESGYAYPCGAAHGSSGTSFFVVDLRAGAEGLPWSDAERDTYTKPHYQKAKDELCADGGVGGEVDGATCGEPGLGGFAPEVTMVFPSFSATEMETLVQYTVETFYAASDGLWGSYTRSARVPVEAPPGFYAEFREIPAPVREYWKKNPPSGEAEGWSAVTGLPSELDALRETFSKAPPMNPTRKGM